jgi:hypothetical protein
LACGKFGQDKRIILTQEGLVELGNGIRSQYDNVRTFFPELRFIELKRYAKRWAEKYVHTIQRICLYGYVPKRLAVYKEVWPGFAVRYALVFELLPDVDSKTLKELETATEQHETMHRGYPTLFDNRFFTVYTDRLADDYYKHWVIFLKEADKEMPLGVMTNEPYWVLYDARISDETYSDGLRLMAHSNVPSTSLSPELFPKLDPIEFTQRAQEWIGNSPLINEVYLYLGKGADKQFVLIFMTQDKKKLAASTFWTDSLIPLQQDLLSIYRDSKDFNISKWQLFTLGLEEGLPVELVRPNHCWSLFRATDEEAQIQEDKIESADETVLWVVYSRTREMLLKDVYGHSRCLAKPNFDSVNDNFFAHVFENATKRFTLKDLSTKGINLNNKSLHKVVDELGFKGKIKKLFFKVTQGVVVFNNPITRKDLLDTNIVVSKTEFSQIFFV